MNHPSRPSQPAPKNRQARHNHPARLDEPARYNRLARALALVAGSVLALLTTAGCGGEPPASLPAGAHEVSIPTEDGETLSAAVVGDGPTGVVVVHGANASRVNWYEAGGAIAASGGLTVVMIDLRGYGSSTGERRTHLDLDIDAAARWVAEQPGVERVALVGSSMGATAVLAMAARHPEEIAGVVALSPPGASTGQDALAGAPGLTMPLLLAAAEDDTTFAESTRRIAEAAGVEPVLVSGGGHGTGMFPDHPELVQRIAAFLAGL